MVTARDRVAAHDDPTSPADERAGPSPLQLIWTILMVAFLAAAFIAALVYFL
jgi:hypothetical protein